jgi:hypothetical protein
MEARIADHVWSIEEIVDLLEMKKEEEAALCDAKKLHNI